MSLSKQEVADIFDRATRIFPQLMTDRHTGKPYTSDHPGAQSIATILKFKLEATESLSERIEASKRKFLAPKNVCPSDDVCPPSVPPPTLGDFMKQDK